MCCNYGRAVCADAAARAADDDPALLRCLDEWHYREDIRGYNSVFQMATSTAEPTVLPRGVQQVRGAHARYGLCH